MIENLSLLLGQAKKAASLIKSHKESIRVFGQYDADGITATSIFVKTLMRENKSFHSTILKQLTKTYFPLVESAKENLLVFIDFGSGQLNFLNKLKDKKIIIVDHHQPQGKPEDHIIQINPLDFGIEENISASGVSYLLSITIDKSNKDLSELAIVGAIGDSQAESTGPDWGVSGLNKEILKDSIDSNKISLHKGLRIWGRTMRPIHKALEYSIDPLIPNVSGSESGAVKFLQDIGIELKKGDGSWRTLSDLSQEEQKKLASGIIIERIGDGHQNPEWIFGDVYELLDRPKELRDAGEVATMINACGKTGKPYLGMQLCLGNPSASIKIKTVLEEYRRSLGAALNWIGKNKENKKETDHCIYILAGDNISEHILSNVISISHKNISTNKPLIGLAISEEGLKISARATDKAVEQGINLKEIMSAVSAELGGEGGGHAAASGATIPGGAENQFIEKVDNLIQAATNKHINTKVDKWSKEAEEKLINGLETHLQSSYAKTRPQEIGAKREGEAGKGQTERPASSQTTAYKSGGDKKMERKGLVQYLVS